MALLVNRFNIIVLDGFKDGKRYRLSTGIKSTKKFIKYYSQNFTIEFDKLYLSKFPALEKVITFKDYGDYNIRYY